MADLKVVFQDPMAASRTFHQSGEEFGQIYPKGGIHSTRVSTAELATALGSVLNAIGQGHTAIAASIESYSVKLRRAHDAYRHADLNSKQLMRALENPDAIQ